MVAGDRILRVAAIALALGLGAVGLAQPGSVLVGGLAWLGFLVCVSSGWGFLVARLVRASDVDLGLRAVWGLAGYLAIAGALIALGVCTRPVILALIAVGAAAFAWRELVTEVPAWARARDAFRYARANPGWSLLIGLVVAIALFHIAGAAAALDRNPWDDDIAYTPLTKRLLDRGDLIEPFSFRRLGAYGGQTALAALAAARGTLANVHVMDKGLCFAVVLLSMTAFARERKCAAMWTAIVALVVVLLPDISINTGAQWSGVALFLGLYRTVVREHWKLVGLVAAATCTLRQNYLAIVVLFVAVTLLARLLAARRETGWAAAWIAERRRWLVITGVGLAAIAMWCVAAVRSSDTFLFPVIGGTWNHTLSVTPAVVTWVDELSYLAWACIDSAPLTVVPVLCVVLAFTRDARRGRPLASLFIATAVGFAVLVHGLVGTEPSHAWRYVFGAGIALAIALVIEVGAEAEAPVELAPLGRWVLLAGMLLQLAVNRAPVTKRFATEAADVRAALVIGAHGDPVAAAEERRYRAMQAAIPAGAGVAVMLDDPEYLDFARNPIANLDTPGFASPGTQLPSFMGAEPIRAYLVDQGERYLAFVRSERSRYFYRRPFWLWRYFNDGELFQAMSVYAIDAIDAFAELATTTKVLYDADGLVVVDLASPLRPASSLPALGGQAERREVWTRVLADREGLHDAWSLTTRGDLRFEDGVAPLQFVDGAIDDPAWFDVERPRAPSGASGPSGNESLRGQAIRPVFHRAHLRVRGDTDMHLSLRMALSRNTVRTLPRLDVALDGELLTSAVASQDGRYEVAVAVPRAQLAGGWHDVYLLLSSTADPDLSPRDPHVARLESVEWTPAP